MNKKIMIVTSISILMVVVLVFAQVLSANNSTASLTQESKDKLTAMELTSITKTSCIPISLDQCQFSMADGSYKLGTHKVPIRYCDDYNETSNECLSYTEYNEAEIKDFINDKSEEWLEDFAQVSIERTARAELSQEPKVLGGAVTVNQK